MKYLKKKEVPDSIHLVKRFTSSVPHPPLGLSRHAELDPGWDTDAFNLICDECGFTAGRHHFSMFFCPEQDDESF